MHNAGLKIGDCMTVLYAARQPGRCSTHDNPQQHRMHDAAYVNYQGVHQHGIEPRACASLFAAASCLA